MKRVFSYVLYRIRQHFGFSRTETYGTLLLLLLIVCALLGPWFLHVYAAWTLQALVVESASLPDGG